MIIYFKKYLCFVCLGLIKDLMEEMDLTGVVLIKEDGDLMEVIKDLIQDLIKVLIQELQLIQTVDCVMDQENVLLATAQDVMAQVM
jgi:hypothetical protein